MSLVERPLRPDDAEGLVRLQVRAMATDVGTAALAERLGLVPGRWWSDLVRDLSRPVLPVPMHDGVVLVPLGAEFDADRWSEPLRRVNTAAFADHWGSAPHEPGAWRHTLAADSFRPAFSVAATVEDQVVAFVLGFEFTAGSGWRDLYVDTVATLREWRGRGLAGALLAHVLAAGADGGYATSSLTVDAANATGALGVYERSGYVLERKSVTYVGPA